MTNAIAEVCKIHSGLCVDGVAPNVTIVDFSCDDGDEMRAVFVALRELMPSPQGKVFVRSLHRYVLVSSDSVYAPTYISSGVAEDTTLCSHTSKGYSGEKLRGEMQLTRSVTGAIRDGLLGPSFQAIVFRLPDVLGPYDRSGRFWATVLWATSKVPMLLSPSCTPVRGQLLSFVSGVDVASKVVQIATSRVGVTLKGTVVAYNLACPERTTLVDFVRLVAAEVQDQTGLDVTVRESAPSSYSEGFESDSSSDIIDSSDDEVDACSCDYYKLK
jgi:nucleoside-diphosphate-sugar epimerase